MISKAVGNCIFTTIERPPYDNLTCELFEVSKSWGWIWFSFLELITLEANTKSVTFFLHVSVCSAVRADAEVWYKTYQNRRWSTSCTDSANSSSLPFSSWVPCDRADIPAQWKGWKTHLSMKWVLLPVLITELLVSFSRAPHWQATLLCCQVVEKNCLALLVHFTALAIPPHTQAIGNASGTSTQHLVAAFNSPFRNSTSNITQTAAMMFWR